MIKLDGRLTKQEISSVRQALIKQIKSNRELRIDLMEVSDVDSAAIAFLVELKQIAKSSSCNLTYNCNNPIIERLSQLYRINL